MLIKDVLKEFIFDCEVRKLSKRTIKTYRTNNELFFTYIEKELNVINLEDLNHLHIKKYFQFLIEKKLKATYANSILKGLRAFLKYCMQEEYVSKNICKQVSWQREGKVIIKTFNESEVSEMLKVYDFSDYLNARNKTILAILLDTGIRNLELCNLTYKDIGERFITVQGKGNKQRYVGISPQLMKHMIKYERIKEQYFKNRKLTADNYFLSRNGRPLTVEAVERVLGYAGKVADIRKEIRCSPHTCRHWFAQAQLKNGLDVYSLSRLLGHENIMITRRYLQSIQDEDIVERSIRSSPLMNLR